MLIKVRLASVLVSVIFLLGTAEAAFDSVSDTGSGGLQIRRIIPAGEDVPPGRQIVIEFDRPMVPIGRMARDGDEVPINVTPDPRCQWRWLNTSSLACQLDQDNELHPATRYTVRIDPGFVASDGERLRAPVTHSFITQRPDVRWPSFITWRSPGFPVIRLVFNQEVSSASVARHVFVKAEGDGSARVGVDVYADTTDPGQLSLIALPNGKTTFGFQPSVAPELRGGGTPSARTWLIAPRSELALDQRFGLHLEPGLSSSAGPEPGAKERLLVQFDTFPGFRFIGVRCLGIESNHWELIARETKLADQIRCDPLRGAGLVFSTPVPHQEVKTHITFTPDLAGGRKDYDPWANRSSYSNLNWPHQRGENYVVWLPERLLAAQQYQLSTVAKGLRDEFGRTLNQPLDMRFTTDHRRPNLVLTHHKAVLEKPLETDVPLYVTNLERVDAGFTSLTTTERVRSVRRAIEIPTVEDVSFAVPAQSRQMLEGQSGAVSGYLKGRPSDHVNRNAYSFFATVTPFQIHTKLGHFNSLVWVTDMASGEPVAGATVSIHQGEYAELAGLDIPSFGPFRTDKHGLAILPGLEVIDPSLSLINNWRDSDPRWFLRVDKNHDLGLLPLDHHFRVWSYGVGTHSRPQFGHIRTWGTTAQGVYRAGDTIQYKLYVRNQDTQRFVAPPLSKYRLTIVDPLGKELARLDELTLSKFGAYEGEVVVPVNAAVGWYQFRLEADFTQAVWTPLKVLVSEFTPSPFKVTAELNGDVFSPGDQVIITTVGRLHSGGPYIEAETRVTARLKAKPFRPTHPVAKRFYFNTFTPGRQDWTTLHQSVTNLDARGEAHTVFPLEAVELQYGQLQIETSVRDDRGKYIADVANAKFVGRDRFVGLRNTKWLYEEDEPSDIEFLVVDATQTIVEDVAVEIIIEKEETKAARVKGAGNAYLTRYDKSWIEVKRCSGVSASLPGRCRFTPSDPGAYRATANVADTRGRPHSTRIGAWVRGKGRVTWTQPNDFQISIIPEKEHWSVGETARYLVRNPLPGARALITIERYGMLESWSQTFETATPVVEFEVKPDFVPGFYLSVVIVSPRVAAPIDANRVDLGKPTFRMGYVRSPVEDPFKRIDIMVTTDRETYKPRERVRVNLRTRFRDESSQGPIELAVAVLDEAVFDLIAQGSDYFDPYAGFYRLDSLDVLNYDTLKGLVGRQKFENKGANPGGDGGGGLGLRSLFKFVSYWNPSLPVDADGAAAFEFTLPDNLTGWRILALGVSPEDRMGLGYVTLKVNKPTEIRPVMPNQVMQGDRFDAGFTVMNRTSVSRRLEVSINATGGATPVKVTRIIDVQPFERAPVWVTIETKLPGRLLFDVNAGDETDRDALVHQLPIKKRRSLETAASYGSTLSNEVSEVVAIPEGIHTDVGAVSVVVSPSVIGNVVGAFRYMRDYPYRCWEQILSVGVMAAHYKSLRDYLPADFVWPQAHGLAQDALDVAGNFQAPNGGMTYWGSGDAYVSAYLSGYTALAFNWLRAAGHDIPATVEEPLHRYLRQLLRKDLMPSFYSRGMSSSVRVVALAALSAHGKVSLDDLMRYESHVPYMSLFGKAHYMDAARSTPGAEALLATVLTQIEAHASVSGGKFQFNETIDDGYQQLLATPLRSNCAILTGLTVQGERDPQRIGDLPFKLVRAITQTRGNRDHWENTQENVYCMNGLVEFARVYERTAPKMHVTARVDSTPIGEAEFTDVRDGTRIFSRDLRPDDPGETRKVLLTREGEGRLYYSTRLRFAPLVSYAERTNAGIDIRREYAVQRDDKWVLLEEPFYVERGELVRADIFLSLPTARHFVVVDDPVPGGLEPVNRDLANTSVVDAEAGDYKTSGGSWWYNFDDWRGFGQSRWSFYHRELRHDAVRFFSDYLPGGNYHLSYSAQAIASGEFSVLPVHSEEMYDPDVFGKGVPNSLRVTDL